MSNRGMDGRWLSIPFLYRVKVFMQLELEQTGEESAIEEIVRKVIEGNSKSFEAYKADKDKA